MAGRIRMTIEDAPLTAAGPDLPPPTNGRFHVMMVLETDEAGTVFMTGDKRYFEANSITWRDLPFPCMATDKTNWGHEDAVLIGNFDTCDRQGNEVHGWGQYLNEPGEDAARLIAMVKSGELRGFSVDIDAVEFELLLPVAPPETEGESVDEATDPFEDNADDLPRENIDGQDYVVVELPEPILRATEARLMGGTVCTMPAFQEAFIEDDSPAVALAAGGGRIIARPSWGRVVEAIVAAGTATAPAPGREGAPARFDFPDIPPAAWFDVPETPGPMPLTILDSGQVFGHLAVWGECHIGVTGECVEPPPSTCNYARFHVGEIPVDNGGRVSVGRLTFHTGHADLSWDPQATVRHYDDSGTAAADLVAMDGVYGIWVCGAMRPGLSTLQVREIMSSPPSGDWRRFGHNLELVAALAVNVPGFNTPRDGALLASGRLVRARVRRDEGLTSALILSHPAPPAAREALLASMATGIDPATARRIIQRVAASIGHDPRSRVDRLAARVRGGR